MLFKIDLQVPRKTQMFFMQGVFRDLLLVQILDLPLYIANVGSYDA